MPKTVTLAPNVWTELTSADATAVTVSNTSGLIARLSVTSGPAPSDPDNHGFALPVGATLVNTKLSELSPGNHSGVRLWARASGHADIWIDHKHEVV
jgi:hypothetical protein